MAWVIINKISVAIEEPNQNLEWYRIFPWHVWFLGFTYHGLLFYVTTLLLEYCGISVPLWRERNTKKGKLINYNAKYNITCSWHTFGWLKDFHVTAMHRLIVSPEILKHLVFTVNCCMILDKIPYLISCPFRKHDRQFIIRTHMYKSISKWQNMSSTYLATFFCKDFLVYSKDLIPFQILPLSNYMYFQC